MENYKVSVLSWENSHLPLCVTLENEDDYRVVTKNLGNYYESFGGIRTVMGEWQGFVPDEETGLLLEKMGLAEPVTKFGERFSLVSSFGAEYPLYQFNSEKLYELDPKGSADHHKNYVETLPSVIDELNRLFYADMGMEVPA